MKSKWKKSDTPEKIDVVFVEDLVDLGFTNHAVDCVKSGQWAPLIKDGKKWVDSVRKHLESS